MNDNDLPNHFNLSLIKMISFYKKTEKIYLFYRNNCWTHGLNTFQSVATTTAFDKSFVISNLIE